MPIQSTIRRVVCSCARGSECAAYRSAIARNFASQTLNFDVEPGSAARTSIQESAMKESPPQGRGTTGRVGLFRLSEFLSACDDCRCLTRACFDTAIETDRQTDGRTDRQTDRQRERERERQRDRETERQRDGRTDRRAETDTHTHKQRRAEQW